MDPIQTSTLGPLNITSEVTAATFTAGGNILAILQFALTGLTNTAASITYTVTVTTSDDLILHQHSGAFPKAQPTQTRDGKMGIGPFWVKSGCKVVLSVYSSNAGDTAVTCIADLWHSMNVDTPTTASTVNGRLEQVDATATDSALTAAVATLLAATPNVDSAAIAAAVRDVAIAGAASGSIGEIIAQLKKIAQAHTK